MYTIEQALTSKNVGVQHKIKIKEINIILEENFDPKYRNFAKPLVSILTEISAYDSNNKLIEGVIPQSRIFVASDRLADPSSGRFIPEMVEDTFGLIIPDPSFSATIKEFDLLAQTATVSGSTLFVAIKDIILNYISLLEAQNRI